MNTKILFGLLACVVGMTACTNKCGIKDVSSSPRTSVKAGSPDDFEQNTGNIVYFEFNKYNLTPDAAERVDSQAAWLKTYPGTMATVEGHTDERGTSEYNMALGASRAESVRNRLVKKGVESSRLNTISYGKDRPLETVTSEMSKSERDRVHALNRRAVTIVSGAETVDR